MKVNHTGRFNNIDAFVADKIRRFKDSDKSFSSMFEMMFSEKDAIIYESEEKSTTYGEAYRITLGLIPSIEGILGEDKHDSVVGLYIDNSILWIEMFWAILLAGYRPLLLNRRLSMPVLESALDEMGAICVISDGKQFQRRTYLAANISPAGVESSASLQDKDRDKEKEKKTGSEILVMSSGTSDNIKICGYGAEEFYYQINDSYQIIKKCSKMKKHYEGELKQLTFLPFYHVFGLIAVYIWFAFFSRSFVDLPDMSPATITGTIKNHKVTHIFAVPMFWEKVYEQALQVIKARGEETYGKFVKGLKISLKLGNIPLLGRLFRKIAFREVRENLFGESICFMISGGSDISGEVLSFFNGIGYHLANGYGMTEIGITSVELSNNCRKLCAGYVGAPFSSLEYKIEGGELFVKGQSMARRIYENNSVKQRGEWFGTHDLAECVKGHYKILGRKDDLVISASGENLNPVIIEKQVKEGEGLEKLQVALIGVPKGAAKEPVLIIYVEPEVLMANDQNDSGKTAFEELDARVHSRMRELSLELLIRKIVYVKNPLIEENDFKLKRASITQKYINGMYKIAIPGEEERVQAPDDELQHELTAMFAEALGMSAEEIRYQMDFFTDAEGTSLDYFGLGVEIQEKYEVEIPTEEEKLLRTVRDFHEFITGSGK